MSQERIDIIITDGIDSGVAQKIAMIGKAATMANGDLKILQKTLNSLGVSKLQDLTKAIGNFNVAQAKMQAVQEKGRLLQAKTTTEYSRTSAIMSRIANGEKISLQRVNTERERGAIQAARAANEQSKLAGVMSRNEYLANRTAISSIKLAQAQDQTSSAVKKHTTSWIGHIAQVAGGIIVYQGIRSVLAGVVNIVQDAISAVDDYTVSVIQMAGSLTSLAADKTNISAVWRQSLGYSQDLVKTLEKVEANTTLNLESLQVISLEMAKQGVTLDINNAKQIESFTAIANAVALFSRNGEDTRQVMQETQALFSGQARSSDKLSKLLNTIVNGDLKKMVEQWKSQGTSIQEIGQRLDGFILASRALSGTWSAVTTSLSTTFNILEREIFTDILQDWTKGLSQLNDYLREHKTEIAEGVRGAYRRLEFVITQAWDNAVRLKNVLLAMFSVLVLKRIILFALWIKRMASDFNRARNAALALEVALGAGSLLRVLVVAGAALIGFTTLWAGLSLTIWKAVGAADAFGKKQLKEKLKADYNLKKYDNPLEEKLKADYNLKKYDNPLEDDSKKMVINGTSFASTLGSGRDNALQLLTKRIKSGNYIDGAKIDGAKGKLGAPDLTKPDEALLEKREKRNTLLQKWNIEADKELRTATMLNDERDIQNKLDKYNIQLTEKEMNTLNPSEKKQLEEKLRLGQSEMEIGKMMNKVYEDVQGPLRNYNTLIESLNRLLEAGLITKSEHERQTRLAADTYMAAIDPLKEAAERLADETSLLGLYGDELEIATYRLSLMNTLKKEGFNASDVSMMQQVEALTNQKRLNIETEKMNKIYDDVQGPMREYSSTQEALNRLLDAGILKKSQYNEQLNKAEEKYISAIDPLKEMTQALNDQYALIGLVGSELELATYRQQVENTLKAEGKDLTDESTRARIDALVNMKKLNIEMQENVPLTQQLEEGARQWADGLASSLADAALGAEISFHSIASSFAQMILEMTIKSQIIKPLMNSIFPGVSFFSRGGIPNPSTSTIVPAEKGFVTDIPTIFPMAKGGIGIMSEFGQDEAVMPLTRINGTLGVKAVGQGNQTDQPTNQSSQQNSVRIINVLDPAMVKDYLATPEGEGVVINTIKRNSELIRQTIS